MIWPSWDRSLFFAINRIDSALLASAMRILTDVDNWVPFILAGVLALLWLGKTAPGRERGGKWRRAFCRRNPRMVILCLILSVALSDQACYRIKRLTGRPRPCFDGEISGEVIYRGEVYGNRSFPSSHAANSAALATTVSLAYPPLAPVALPLALLVGFSRVYLGVHYPLDVLAGWVTGALLASLVWLLLRKPASRPGIVGFTNRFRFRQPPAEACLPPPWEPVNIASLDGFTGGGYLRREGRELAVIVHGLHEDVSDMVHPGEIFIEMGFSVLIVPLRGHDGHTVPVTSGGPAEVMDLAGALLAAGRDLGFERSGTVLYGTSMGGAVALKTAGLLGDPVGGVIVHGAFRSFFESSKLRLGRFRASILKLLLPAASRRGLKAFMPAEYVDRWRVPGIVYITGERDRISPPRVAEEMAERTGGEVIILKGAGHPLWSCGGWEAPQMKTAFKEAVGRIRGNSTGAICVDPDGSLPVPGTSERDASEREK